MCLTFLHIRFKCSAIIIIMRGNWEVMGGTISSDGGHGGGGGGGGQGGGGHRVDKRMETSLVHVFYKTD
jgi:hypothetical protein